MTHFEFTVQIYENEETAKKIYGNIKSMEKSVKSTVSVLWRMDRKVIKR